MAPHSSVLAWRIPGTGEPGGLPSMGSHRVGHDWSDLAAAAGVHETIKLNLKDRAPDHEISAVDLITTNILSFYILPSGFTHLNIKSTVENAPTNNGSPWGNAFELKSFNYPPVIPGSIESVLRSGQNEADPSQPTGFPLCVTCGALTCFLGDSGFFAAWNFHLCS